MTRKRRNADKLKGENILIAREETDTEREREREKTINDLMIHVSDSDCFFH
jgi:hypothetical protein